MMLKGPEYGVQESRQQAVKLANGPDRKSGQSSSATGRSTHQQSGASGPTVERLYEDDEIVAFWSPGRSDYILVTFGDALELESGERFFADAPVRKADIACIGIVARRPNWYPEASMHHLAQVIRSRLDQVSVRVGYGGSMGGYAAIKHSALLSLTHVIALCPQWSVDPAECDGNEPGFQHWQRPEFAGHGIRPEDVTGCIVLVFDPNDPIDSFHGGRLQTTIPSAYTVTARNVGHHVTKAFAGTANLTEMIRTVIEGDMVALRVLATRLRRASPERAHILLSAAARTHSRMAARALGHPLSGLRNMMGRPEEYQLPLLDRLLSLGAEREIRMVVEAIAERNQDCEEAARLLLLRHEWRGEAAIRRIGTFHGSWIVYDVYRASLRHVFAAEMADRAEDLLPVHVDIVERRADLVILLHGRRFRLKVRRDASCRPIPMHASDRRYRQGDWSIEYDPLRQGIENQLTIKGRTGYLCADYGTTVSCSRTSVDDWECFELG